MLGIEPRTSYMQSMRSTTELHPHLGALIFVSVGLQTHSILLNDVYRTEVKFLCLYLHESN